VDDQVDIDTFVPAAQIDNRFYDDPYYIGPSDKVSVPKSVADALCY
jgi:non-homologous end joining protein Ku